MKYKVLLWKSRKVSRKYQGNLKDKDKWEVDWLKALSSFELVTTKWRFIVDVIKRK